MVFTRKNVYAYTCLLARLNIIIFFRQSQTIWVIIIYTAYNLQLIAIKTPIYNINQKNRNLNLIKIQYYPCDSHI